jgi:tetratricopeptide (TPR) repeat protein
MVGAGLQRITNNSSLYISRGLLFAQLAQFDRAEADFKTAEHFDSAQSLSSYATDLAEIEKNHSENAISRIRSQVKAHPDNPLLHYLLAKLLTSEGSDTEIKASGEAIRSALLAVKLKPGFVDARDLLASMYMRSGQYKLAIEQSRLALQYAPSDRTAIYHLIISLRNSGESQRTDEMPALVKRLGDLQRDSLKQDTERKRYKLVEQQAAPPG